MKLSRRKKDQLYSTVHEDIMSARIKIARLLNDKQIGRPVDDILSDLVRNAPQNALRVFNPTEL